MINLASHGEPIRVNKYLSEAGVCSRREADRLMEQNRIRINGKPAVMGQKIYPKDEVFVDGKRVEPEQERIVIALNKPEGIECTTSKENPDNVVDFVNLKKRVYPIGRLDKNSCGLLLLTNDNKVATEVMSAANYHEKEYLVTLNHPVTDAFVKQMSGGVVIDQFDRNKKKFQVKTRACKVEKVDEKTFSIILTQGFHRQIRRMCEKLGYRVVTLKRIRIMQVKLGDIKEGSFRYLSQKEIDSLLKKETGIR